MTENTVNEQSVAPEIDQAKLKLAEDRFNSFKAELKTKLYPIKVKNMETVAEFVRFIEEDAEWRSMEALGIEELYKAFSKITEVKSGMIYLKNLEVEALHYFLSKVSGKGKASADKFLMKVRIINEAIKMVQADNNQVNILESTVESIRNGISVEMPIEPVTEQEA